MGTSQSINPKSNSPTWQNLKATVTKLSKNPSPDIHELRSFTYAFVKATGGAIRTGSGQSKTFGNAGPKSIRKMMAFISSVSSNGLSESFSSMYPSVDISQLTVDQFINYLLVHCTQGDSLLDETAANNAMDNLLKYIFNSVDEIMDVEILFSSASNDVLQDWLCYFFASYIVEFSSQLFSTHIFEKAANPSQISGEIFSYIKRELTEHNFNYPLRDIDWNSQQGEQLIISIQQEILNIWSQE